MLQISSRHDCGTIYGELYRWYQKNIVQRRDKVRVSVIVLDFNWPSLHASTMALNDMGIVPYLQTCWDIVERRLSGRRLAQITPIVLGRSHIVKDISGWKSMATKNTVVKRTWKVALCQLINVATLAEMDSVWDIIFGLLGSDSAEDAAVHRKSLLERIRQPFQEYIDDTLENVSACDGVQTESAAHKFRDSTIYRSSPFWNHVVSQQRSFHDRHPPHAAGDCDLPNPNPFKNMDLLNVAINVLGAYAPLFSNLLLRKERYARDCANPMYLSVEISRTWSWTEGHTERWMGVVKNTICQGKRLPIAEFVETLHSALKGRVEIFKHAIPRRYPLAAVDPPDVDAPLCSTSVLSPLESQGIFSDVLAQQSEVRNKGHRHTNVNPDAGYLRAPTDIRLLPNGGRIVKTRTMEGDVVTVRSCNTCTIDNLLMCLHVAHISCNYYRNSLAAYNGATEACNTVRQFCSNLEAAETSYAVKEARWHLVRSYPELWEKGYVVRESLHVVSVNLEGSDQDIIKIVLGEMCHLVREHACTYPSCTYNGYCDTMTEVFLPMERLCDVQQWLTELFTLAVVDNCSVTDCDGIRTMPEYSFINGVPPVFVIRVAEFVTMDASSQVHFPDALHLPSCHPQEQ